VSPRNSLLIKFAYLNSCVGHAGSEGAFWRLRFLRVLEKTRDMLTAFGQNNELKLDDYQTITAPCLLLLGENDKMITVDETVAVQNALPQAELKFLPATPHPIEQVDINLLGTIIENSLTVEK
jgi:pimeloyl-ACP methyl ester carboxylesterase